MKKLIALLMALVMVLSMAACGGSTAPVATEAPKADAPAATEAPVEDSGKTVLNIWSFTDEVPKMIDRYLELHPDFAEKYEIKTTIIATTDGLYQPALDQALAAGGADAPDLYCAEAAFILKYAQGDAAKFAAPYADLGIDIDADIAAADKYVVGVIQHDQTQTGVDRANGFIDKFVELADADSTTAGKYEIAHEIKDGDANNAYVAALEALYEKNAQAIFMCNEGVVKQVYDATSAAEGKYDAIKFCGFDAGSKQIEWIKATTGPKLVGSVAQDSFNIGYNAVMECIKAVEGGTAEKVDIAGAWYDATNIDEMIKSNLVYEG